MRTTRILILLTAFALLPGLRMAQGQATLPDELLSREPAAPAPARKPPPRPAPPAKPQEAAQPKAPEKSSVTPAEAQKFPLKFEDTFADNRNHWNTGGNAAWKGEFQGGSYVLEHRRKELGWLVTRTMDFDASKDYLLEAEFSFVDKGPPDAFFALVIGLETKDKQMKFQRFSSTADGVCVYTERIVEGVPFKLVSVSDMLSKTDAPSYRKGVNVKNTITAIHSGDRMHLFVNGVKLTDIKYTPPPGNRVGFMAGLDCTIRIHRLTYRGAP